MAGLKLFLPKLSEFFHVSPAALYTRQRALMKIGVLTASEGRGPGSGVALSYNAVAATVIALMAADTLQETDDRVLRLCRAKPPSGRCPLTGTSQFADAMTEILEAPEIGGHVVQVRIVRTTVSAEIIFRRSQQGEPETSFFQGCGRARLPIEVAATINPIILKHIRREIKRAMEQDEK